MPPAANEKRPRRRVAQAFAMERMEWLKLVTSSEGSMVASASVMRGFQSSTIEKELVDGSVECIYNGVRASKEFDECSLEGLADWC